MRTNKRKQLRIKRTFKIHTNLRISPPIPSTNKFIKFLKKTFNFKVGVNQYVENNVVTQQRYMSIVLFRYQIQLIHK